MFLYCLPAGKDCQEGIFHRWVLVLATCMIWWVCIPMSPPKWNRKTKASTTENLGKWNSWVWYAHGDSILSPKKSPRTWLVSVLWVSPSEELVVSYSTRLRTHSSLPYSIISFHVKSISEGHREWVLIRGGGWAWKRASTSVLFRLRLWDGMYALLDNSEPKIDPTQLIRCN